MATAQQSCLEQIGDTAGLLWHDLNENGPRTLTQLAKDVDAPVTDAVDFAAFLGAPRAKDRQTI